MAASREEAIGFVRHLLTGQTRTHLEAVLGDGRVASVEDFSSADEGAIERSLNLVAVLETYASALKGVVSQSEKKLEAAKKREKDNTLKGMDEESLKKLNPPEEGEDEEERDNGSQYPKRRRKAAAK